MNASTYLRAAIGTLALALLAAAPVARDLRFAPREGLEREERFDAHWTLELERQAIQVTIDGEEIEQESPEGRVTIETRDDYTFQSEVLEVSDEGRVTRLRRTLEHVVAVSSESAEGPEGETYEETREGETELEGVPVVFVWDADDERYRAEFDEDAEVDDEDLLEGLEGEDVLAAFLGPEDAEEGDTWSIDLDAFRRLSNPGGDLKIVKEGDAEDQDQFEQDFYENLEGEILAEHGGVRDVDGRRLTVIDLEFSLATEVQREQDLEGEDVEGSVQESFAFRFELAGELLWDEAAGHAAGLELTGEIELDLSRDQRAEGPGGEIEVNLEQEFAGEFTYSASAE